jgi:hypothetical protein
VFLTLFKVLWCRLSTEHVLCPATVANAWTLSYVHWDWNFATVAPCCVLGWHGVPELLQRWVLWAYRSCGLGWFPLMAPLVLMVVIGDSGGGNRLAAWASEEANQFDGTFGDQWPADFMSHPSLLAFFPEYFRSSVDIFCECSYISS